MPLDAHAIGTAFTDRSLPKPEWTHEAHLAVCWWTLQRMTPAAAIEHLRGEIRAYNEASGTANTDHDGYHETVTRYYVLAVASVHATDVGAVFTAPACSRTAPLQHWSRDVLWSVAARREWVAPDLSALPFGWSTDAP